MEMTDTNVYSHILTHSFFILDYFNLLISSFFIIANIFLYFLYKLYFLSF